MGELFYLINQLLSRQKIFKMGNDYVNAMLESLQSNKNKVNCSEVFGLVCYKSFSFNCCYIVNLIFITLIVCVVWKMSR